jgi:flagellar motility protein MotE (MotC chaperone)
MIKVLTAPWMSAVLGVVLYLGTTAAVWKMPKLRSAQQAQTSAQAEAQLNGPSWNFTNPEADQLLAELQAEKEAVAKKDQDLNDLRARLQAEQSELNVVTQSVQQLEMAFDQNVLRISAEETANLKKLAKVYADMDPANAAKILEEMDDVSIIKIMTFMKDTETAAIWEAMAKEGETSAKRAALLSDRLRLTSYRSTTSP